MEAVMLYGSLFCLLCMVVVAFLLDPITVRRDLLVVVLLLLGCATSVPAKVSTFYASDVNGHITLNPQGKEAPKITVRVSKAIYRAAIATKADANLLATFANIESSFDADVNKRGLMQIMPSTASMLAKRHAKKHGFTRINLRDPYHSAVLAAELINDNTEWMEARLKRPVQPHEVYLGYFISPHYALKIIKAKGNKRAIDVLPASYRAGNYNMLYNKSNRAMTVREFISNVKRLLRDKRMEYQTQYYAKITIGVCVKPSVSLPYHSSDCLNIQEYGRTLWGDRRSTYGVV